MTALVPERQGCVAHHYVCDPPRPGVFDHGVCKYCGHERDFNGETKGGNYMGVTKGKTQTRRACRDCAKECVGERCKVCAVAYRNAERARARTRRRG